MQDSQWYSLLLNHLTNDISGSLWKVLTNIPTVFIFQQKQLKSVIMLKPNIRDSSKMAFWRLQTLNLPPQNIYIREVIH